MTKLYRFVSTFVLIISMLSLNYAQSGPNCVDLNASVNFDGDVNFTIEEIVPNIGGASATVTITRSYGGIVYGPATLSAGMPIIFEACPYLRETLKVTVEIDGQGSCWSYLTFKQGNGPIIEGRTKDVYCFDPLVAGGHINDEPPAAGYPCVGMIAATHAADWIINYECAAPGEPVNDTAKVILREYEAFDKNGNRASGFDTIVVFRIPPIDIVTDVNAYCAEKDTTYCGEGFAGPFMLIPERCDPALFGQDQDGDGVPCDTLYFLVYDTVTQMWVENPIFQDNKCGLGVHVDKWVFEGSSCEQQVKYVLDIKQSCIGTPQTACTVMPVPTDNAFEEVAEGYYRCEFWLTDLDTVPPKLVCKGDPLFTGPFDIGRWTFETAVDDFFFDQSSQAINAPVLDYKQYFDFSALPYSFSIVSQQDHLHMLGDGQDEVAQPFLAGGLYSANAYAGFTAERSGTFDFTWDFTLEPYSHIGHNGNILMEELPPACVSIFITINGVPFYLLDPETDDPLDGLCGLLMPPDQQAQDIYNLFLPPLAITRSQSGVLSVPLQEGDEFSIVAIWDSPSKATLRIMGQNLVSTSSHECAAHSYIPRVKVYDDWSGIKQVKARVEGVGSYLLTYDETDNCYVSHEQLKLPKREEPYKVIYEGYDSCHNIGLDSCYIVVKDRTRPVAIADKGVTVSLSDKKVWVHAETFDEGSWDNCGVNLLLARRSDWYEACIDLCDSVEACYVSEHHDTLWQSILQPDKHRDEVEAHYAKTLKWLCEDGTPCAEIIYNSWQYDLMKYATLECIEHPYNYTEEHFKELFAEAIYYGEDFFEKFYYCDPFFNNIFLDGFINFFFLQASYFFEVGHMSPFHDPTDNIDMYAQIGGGWAEEVPFSCDDACGPVTVELLVMDYWCNWSKAWTTVWVEDKTPVSVEKDVYTDEEISCKTYKDARYSYPGEIHPVSIEYIVEQSKTGDSTALAQLDAIFGGYCKAWVDPYGNYVDIEGNEIDCDIYFYDSSCYCTTDVEEVRVYDEHLGYLWKDSLVTDCYYEEDTLHFQKGIIAVNCADNVFCEQEVWCDIDHCGQGYIFRKWKIWQGCPDSYYKDEAVPDSLKHPVDTIYRSQRIWVGNQCELSKYMFDVPEDMTVYTCGIDYDPEGSGNVVGEAGPENTGYATYKFDDDCRIVGIAHTDKVFKIVGGEEACYKIYRTWYFADWCGYGGKPVKENWYKDYDLVVDSCVQKIIVQDTMPPVCTITGPVGDGETITIGACEYDLNVTVDAADACGISKYYWELKDVSDPDAVTVFDDGHGELNADTSDVFDISSENLYPGSYTLIVTVQDECNNESYCKYNFELEAGKKPSPICVTNISARLTPWDSDQDGEIDTAHAVVWAGEFDSSSEPACTDDSLGFRIEFLDLEGDSTYVDDADSLELGCADIGTHLVRLWVISYPSETVDYCDVILTVQSDFTGCFTNGTGAKTETVQETAMNDAVQHPGKHMMEGEQTELNIPGDAPASSGIMTEGYELEQNRPNPFRNETMVGFVLPQSMQATITVHDVTGRVLREVKGSFAKGYNTVQFRKSDLGVSGILYYRLQAGSYTATRKMVLVN